MASRQDVAPISCHHFYSANHLFSWFFLFLPSFTVARAPKEDSAVEAILSKQLQVPAKKAATRF
jgi:hypothetical protein